MDKSISTNALVVRWQLVKVVPGSVTLMDLVGAVLFGVDNGTSKYEVDKQTALG